MPKRDQNKEPSKQASRTLDHELKRVSLCGRPNVGKSTLFNRLIGKKKAIVLDEPGVTRDVFDEKVEWKKTKPFILQDLAGLELWDEVHSTQRLKKVSSSQDKKNNRNLLQRLAYDKALEILKDSDLVLFIVDARDGLTPADMELSRIVRKYGREVLVVLSKAEGRAGDNSKGESLELGFGEPLITSAEHNLGIDELKDEIKQRLDLVIDPLTLPFEPDEIIEEKIEPTRNEEAVVIAGTARVRPLNIGVYGRPNVGKSTLVNSLLGENRMITSEIAGTTVDSVFTEFIWNDRYYRIVDTAGIRKKSKTEQGVEVISVVKALGSMSEVDIALFLIDGYEGVADQDEKVAGELFKSGKPVVIVVNKWDICRGKREQYAERVRKALPFLSYAPVMFISAKSGEGLDPLPELFELMLKSRLTLLSTPELNRFFEDIEGENNPNGAKIYFATQTLKNPPTFTLKVNDQKKFHYSYERFLMNSLRSHFNLMGSPIRFKYESKSKKIRL